MSFNTLIIDNREPEKLKNKILDIFKIKNKQINIITQRLNIGDIIYGNVIFERKTFRDFLNSVYDKRLEKQKSILEQYNTILILECNYIILDNKEQKIFDTNLVDLMLRNIKIIYSFDISNTAYIIYQFIEKLTIGISNKILSYKKFTPSIENEKIQMLMAINGIGEKKALKLIDNFKTIKNIANASIENLKNYFSESLSNKIYEVFNK